MLQRHAAVLRTTWTRVPTGGNTACAYQTLTMLQLLAWLSMQGCLPPVPVAQLLLQGT